MSAWEGLSPPYGTVVADPPWPYRDASGNHCAIPKNNLAHRRVSDLGYGTLTLADLLGLPVELLVGANAHLYLWTTNAFMEEAHQVARAWGFTPKTILTWVKVYQDDRAWPSMRTGYYFRGATEHVVFAVRGSRRLLTSEGVPTAFLWPRLAHSVKPPPFFDMVERCSPGPHVELFARQPRLGWDSWGKGYEAAS